MKPWFRNIENALRKTPKWYLRDWSAIADEGKRVETLVACHLLKAVETWTDLGLGDYGLYYIRTSRKEEVDFLVSRDGAPWFLAEVKVSDATRSGRLDEMRRLTGASFALQLVANLPYEQVDCFEPTNGDSPSRALWIDIASASDSSILQFFWLFVHDCGWRLNSISRKVREARRGIGATRDHSAPWSLEISAPWSR